MRMLLCQQIPTPIRTPTMVDQSAFERYTPGARGSDGTVNPEREVNDFTTKTNSQTFSGTIDAEGNKYSLVQVELEGFYRDGRDVTAEVRVNDFSENRMFDTLIESIGGRSVWNRSVSALQDRENSGRQPGDTGFMSFADAEEKLKGLIRGFSLDMFNEEYKLQQAKYYGEHGDQVHGLEDVNADNVVHAREDLRLANADGRIADSQGNTSRYFSIPMKNGIIDIPPLDTGTERTQMPPPEDITITVPGLFDFTNRNPDGTLNSPATMTLLVRPVDRSGNGNGMAMLFKAVPKDGVENPDPNNLDHWELDVEFHKYTGLSNGKTGDSTYNDLLSMENILIPRKRGRDEFTIRVDLSSDRQKRLDYAVAICGRENTQDNTNVVGRARNLSRREDNNYNTLIYRLLGAHTVETRSNLLL